MDKVDRDDSTPPDSGGKAEPNAGPDPAVSDSTTSTPGRPPPPAPPELTAPRSVPAVTKAPAPVRSIGGGYYVPPKPPVRYVPPAPPGFVAFADIPDRLFCLAFVYDIPFEHLPNRADLRAIARVIEFHLAAGHARAAGICTSTGEMMWATAATWRTPGLVNGRRESVAFLALNGGAVRFSFPLRRQLAECYPILPCWMLARMFGAQDLPAKPSRSVLRGIRKMETRERQTPRIEAKAVLAAKKPPVAPAALLAKWKDYVAQHRDPNQRPNVAAQRAAMAAAFPNHAPPNEQTMRKLRAHPDMPPGWSTPGPRKQSG